MCDESELLIPVFKKNKGINKPKWSYDMFRSIGQKPEENKSCQCELFVDETCQEKWCIDSRIRFHQSKEMCIEHFMRIVENDINEGMMHTGTLIITTHGSDSISIQDCAELHNEKMFSISDGLFLKFNDTVIHHCLDLVKKKGVM